MISVIIPTYNEEKIIGRTLANLASFKKFSHEIIISDSNSTDQTVAIAKNHGVKVVITKERGIAKGRNLGARTAQGEYLVFLDADVQTPEPDKFFGKVLSFFENDVNLVGLSVFLKVLPELETKSDRFFSALMNCLYYFLVNILNWGGVGGEFQMVKKQAFEKLGGYNENLAASEDFDFFNRLKKLGKTKFTSSLCVYHTARRAHQVGWPKLMMTWFLNSMSMIFFKKSVSKEWEAVR